ncbi:hypothetical protein GVN21_06435 [Caulobacter sp. SLTY]|uniref:hypothetical protein n=1 Tax=Caulobacter sp. SLTY TaxID=2683262 RepID=UPI0014123A66|nr:hypothetical protein [Caulobacter sp. SLTY]NBB14989.1 hypothetical protein [Caulobacter sp. SLTY]
MRFIAALGLAALLAACGKPVEEASPTEPPAAPAPAEPTHALAPAAKAAVSLDPEGLRLVVLDSGSTRLLAFGRPTAEAVEVLSGILGQPASRSTNAECGAGPTEFVEYGNGLSALFLDGKFSGWSADAESAAKVTFMNGIGVGSTRQALTENFADLKVEESTLGIEFTAGEVSGLLDQDGPAGKVTTLWAGTSCVFR